ncbi:gamma-glutamylcyclotransferase [Celeribacter sp.]|uniref:gamma-glutamylcyclotransferase n=1 Tax=Celeribacter sp. TaxID=1890673 RepID=UPI003A959197
MNSNSNGFWVFGYGSLMWNPEFTFAERIPATLTGYARSFCMWSIHHRGSPEEPGLVLALDAETGASCRGLAYHVTGAEAGAALARLRERELVSSAYLECTVPLALDDGRTIDSLAYVVDRGHEQYTGLLSLEAQADVIAAACGGRGPNCEYLFNTALHLAELGMEDRELDQLADLVRLRIAQRGCGG